MLKVHRKKQYQFLKQIESKLLNIPFKQHNQDNPEKAVLSQHFRVRIAPSQLEEYQKYYFHADNERQRENKDIGIIGYESIAITVDS